MQDVIAFCKKAFEICLIFLSIDLGGFGVGTLGHCFVKIFKIYGLSQVIFVFYAVQFIMKAYIGNVSFFKMFRCKVGSGAATQNIL